MFSKHIILAALVLSFVAVVAAETFFYEPFHAGWEKRWVKSKAKDNYGEWKYTAGEWYGDAEEDKGIQTSQDARHYSISAKFDKPATSRGEKPLVLQFSTKHPQNIDCGGAYIKFLPTGANQEDFKDDTEYRIMFGPDVCGSATRRVHFIFNYKGKNLLWKKTLPCETDQLTHIYTAIINPDASYEVQIDGVKKESGNLYDDWDFLAPKEIPDPQAKKPADWVDEKEIVDPEDKKPEDWDQPKYIPDPQAKKPEDWSDEEDGTWEAPQIPNPDYKGEWKPRMIPNPAYKGEWSAPLIPNPDYVFDENVAKYDDIDYAGIEIWQVKAGTIFDNILVTDDIDVAREQAQKVVERAKKEKEAFDKIEAAKRQKEEEERKKREEEEARKKTEEAPAEEKKAEHDEL
ncbi:hypothetical protein C9374_006832 [Naegleria lovaniensis]|uniref:Calreticulin n=1 Tax=Naegleria lovaniensis TaxID=51637 RepID=A0AA88H3R2_NAELO|nr:uncharacterized protein C9374_006832 [Naegleria lovaniensis]KAG2393301.1 hypothetical protein C9374_006832 [Naegleria lovaniensis]